MRREPLYAWQAGRDVLVLACPSSRGGFYLVAVGPADGGADLVVVHECPAARARRPCWHLAAALKSYLAWRPGARYGGVRTSLRPVRLNPSWKQVPVPGAPQTRTEVVA